MLLAQTVTNSGSACDLSHGSDQDRESQCVEIFTNRTVVQFYAQYSTHACPLPSIDGYQPRNGFTRASVLAGRCPDCCTRAGGKRANGCDSWARWSHLLTWQLVTALGEAPVVLVKLPSGSVCDGDSNTVP